jgi:hypothetical protein
VTVAYQGVRDSFVEIPLHIRELFDSADLTGRELSCIFWRYWLGCTLNEVGKRDCGISGGAARRRIVKALWKLRRSCVAGGTDACDWLRAFTEGRCE